MSNDSSAFDTGPGWADSTAGELIARLEAATEGSRELDIGVHAAKHGWGIPATFDLRGPAFQADANRVPHYTTSLDAAMSLVPEGWQWEITNNAIERGFDRCVPPNDTVGELGPFATLQRPPIDGVLGGLDWFGPIMVSAAKGATPAIALCIAAIKARTPAAISQDDKAPERR